MSLDRKVQQDSEEDIVDKIYDNDFKAVKQYFSVHPITADARFQLSYSRKFQMVLPNANLSFLHIAAAGDSLEVFIYLESLGLKLDIKSAASYLPIHYACQFGSLEIVSYILGKDPEMATIEPQVEFHLLYLTATEGNPEIMTLLFNYGVNPNSWANKRNNPILKSVQSRNFQCLQILLKNGEVPPKDDEYSFAMRAAMNLQPAAVEYIIEQDSHPINFCSPITHQTLLGLCCFTGMVFKPVILKLLRLMDDVEPPGSVICQGAVHWICTIVDVEICQEFLKHKIRVNRLDADGKSGFHYLNDKDAKLEPVVIKIMELLIEAGFDINIRRANLPGLTTPPSVLEHFILAISKSYKIIEFLIKNGANIYAIDKNGKPLVETVINTGKNEQIKNLFKLSPMYGRPPPPKNQNE